MYEAGQELIDECEHRLELKDSAYSICSKSLFDCTNKLEKTTTEYEKIFSDNLYLGTEIKRIKRQRNYIVVGGICITGILTMMLFTL